MLRTDVDQLESLLVGMAVPTLFLWPLPLLHGRKTYLLLSISLFLPLQLPQALPLLVNNTMALTPTTFRQVNEGMTSHAIIVLVFRCISGVILGFANVNILAELTDMWGVDTGRCCRAGVYSPSELIMGDERRRVSRGGGLGVWVGLWASIMVGGASMGYSFGVLIRETLHIAWGFWIIIIEGAILVGCLVLTPETRLVRSTPLNGNRILPQTSQSPLENVGQRNRGELRRMVSGKDTKWWWQEVWAGWVLMKRMCSQSGFLLILLFSVWAFCTVCMVQQLLYRILISAYTVPPPDIAICVLAIPLGAALSIPFQVTFARCRSRLPNGPRSYNNMTTNLIRMSPHPADRHQIHAYPFTYYIFVVTFVGAVVGFAVAAEVAMDEGRSPGSWWILVMFSAMVGWAGALALAETTKIIMDIWDLSGLEEIEFSRVGSVNVGTLNGGRFDGSSEYGEL